MRQSFLFVGMLKLSETPSTSLRKKVNVVFHSETYAGWTVVPFQFFLKLDASHHKSIAHLLHVHFRKCTL